MFTFEITDGSGRMWRVNATSETDAIEKSYEPGDDTEEWTVREVMPISIVLRLLEENR